MTIKHTLKAKIFLFIAILYSILILVLSLANLNRVEIVKLESSDKFYHAACYTLLSFLWVYFVKLKFEALKIRIIFATILLISIFGIIIEYLQLVLTDYRTFDWWDVLANFTGVIFGILTFKLHQKLFNL